MNKNYPYRVRIAYHGADDEGPFRLVVFAGFERHLKEEQQQLLEDLCEEHLSEKGLSDDDFCHQVDTILDTFETRTGIHCDSVPAPVMQDIEIDFLD